MDSTTRPSKIVSLPFIVAGLLTMTCAAASTSDTTSTSSAKAVSDKSATSKTAAAKAAPATKPETATSSDAAAAAKPIAQVLDPSQFFGEVQAAYAAAKECPDLCANLFCYCGCDFTDKHSSLLDCFTSEHSADCQICRDEVFMALGMKKQGKTLAEIQSAIDDKFSGEYPFKEPSPALAAYRAKKAGKPLPKQPAASNNKTSEADSPPVLKPGKKAGNCCGHKS